MNRERGKVVSETVHVEYDCGRKIFSHKMLYVYLIISIYSQDSFLSSPSSTYLQLCKRLNIFYLIRYPKSCKAAINEKGGRDFDFGNTREHEILRCNLVDAIGPSPLRFTFTSTSPVLGSRRHS